MAIRPLVCFCCGADITAPQFFQGKAYGYTCIKKVSDQKQVKDAGLWVTADSVTLEGGLWAIFTVQGVQFKLMYGVNGNGQKLIHNGNGCIDQPMIKLAMFKNGKKPLYTGSKVANLIKTLTE